MANIWSMSQSAISFLLSLPAYPCWSLASFAVDVIENVIIRP